MKPTVISEASVAALPALSRLFKQAVESHFDYFPPAVRRRVIAEHSVPHLLRATLDRRRVVLVARRGQELVGYCLGAAPTHGPAQIYWLYVNPDARGANLGLNLLSRMLKLLAARGARDISIATHNHRRYYERQGFKFLHQTTADGVSLDVMAFEVRP
jgi:ribosomal protein S18 acetylase RimI-like enzyme